MTEIDYYLLGDTGMDVRELFAARLAEKAFRNKLQVYLHAEDEKHAQSLDELLWSYRHNSFLPHEISHDGSGKAPLLIGYGEKNVEHHQLLINLSHQRPGFFSSFERVMELVIEQEPLQSQSRENYRYYKERGYKLTVHQCQAQAESIAQAIGKAE